MTTYLAKGLSNVITNTAVNTNNLLYINTADTSVTADLLGETTSIAFTRMNVTGAYTTGHIVWLNAANIGTPFQLVVHDSSDMYLYKRYKSSGTWTAWAKMKAGTADTWTTARTLTIGNTGKSVNGSAAVSWSKDEILGSSTSANFLRGDKAWSSTLTDQFLVYNNTSTRGDAYSGGIQLREYGCQTTSCTLNWYNAPGITFHWGGRWANKLAIYTNGGLYWGGTQIVTNSGTWGISISGNAATCTYPLGFSSRGTNATWGNQTGSTVTVWNDSQGGSVDWRTNNPSSGKLSIKVDGRFYGNEGTYPAMLMRHENSYWGLCDPDAANNVWIRTTSQGIIPYQSGARGSGHCGLGTSSWYFSYAYVDTYYANKYSTGHGYINGAATNGGLNMILAGDDIWLGDCNIGGRLGLKSNNTADAGIACYGSDGTRRGIFYANSTGWHTDVKLEVAVNTFPLLTLTRTDSAETSIYIKNATAGWALGIHPWSVGAGVFAIGQYFGTGSSAWRFKIDNSGYCYASSRLYNAVWNDLAEYRKCDNNEPGYMIEPSGSRTTSRLESGARIISDTYGLCLGYGDNDNEAPVGIAGRVLAYTYKDRNEYKVGDAVCTASGGTIDIMTRQEIMTYPDRIVGIVNEIPDYDVWERKCEGWGGYTVEVRGRIWIDIK